MTETSVIALLGAPTPAEDAPRPTMIRRRRPEPEDRPPPDLPQPPPPQRHHIDRRAGEVIAQGAGEPDDLLSTSDVSEWLGISTQWLEIARHRGFGPKFIRLSPKRVRYLRSSVIEWLRERQHQATAEYARRSSAGAPVDAA